MTLQDLFETLAYGELNQHKYGSSGTIEQADYPAVISHTNRALTTLHSRLPLLVKEVLIAQYSHITQYELKKANTISEGTSSHPYIVDTVESPFTEDVLRIEAAYDGEGNSIPINDEYRNDSWFTPAPDILQIPFPVEDNHSAVIYKAKHPVIPTDTLAADADRIQINIPTCLEAALTALIASRIFVSLGNPSSASLSSFYQKIYEKELSNIERFNLLRSSESDSNIRFVQGGWK